MFRFEHVEILWFLLGIPALVFIFYLLLKWKENQIRKLGDPAVIKRLFPNWSVKKEWLKTILLALGFFFGIIALANPQWGNRKQRVTAKSTDVILALDISQSMMAEDISPNRIEVAKRFTAQLIKSLRGERIGLIYFAGSAYMQMPLTNDYAAAELFIKSANTTQAGTQGTAIAEAIDLAQVSFGSDNPTQKALIIISDGENHDNEAIQAAKQAKDNGTFIYTIAVGSEEGAMVPFMNRGRKEFKKDRSGNPVKSAINIPMMKDLADAGGGSFYIMEQSPKLMNQIKSEINKLEKKEVEQRSFTDYASYFQYFLLIAILFFVFEQFLSNSSNSSWSLRKFLNI